MERYFGKITLSSNTDTSYKGDNIELSVEFENFTEIPSSVEVYESNQSEPVATSVSVTDGKISFSSDGLNTGSHSLFVQAGNTKSNTISVTILAKKIQITAVSKNVLSGAAIEFSVSFKNFIENPDALDVYESNQSEPVATGVSVTDGKISFSSIGLEAGSHSLFVQAGNTKSNTKSVTILAKKIQITAVSENVLSGAAIELSVSFENFIENPGTLDVYESNLSEPVATGVSVTDGKISFSSMSLDAGTYNFYVKTNNITSNIINIQIVKKEIKLNSLDTSVFVGNTIDIPIEFLNYTEEPTSVDVYKNNESLPFLTNISVSNNKISIPLSLDLENTSIYVKADSESSNALSIDAVGLLNQDGSYTVTVSSLNKVAKALSSGNQTFKVIGECTSENLKNSIESGIFNKLDSCVLDLSKVTGLTNISSYLFSGYTSLTSIVLPDTVTALGENAFYGCSSLTNINIPDGVNAIDEFAFYNCSSLTNINIPSNLTKISERTFYGCSSLTNVNIPDTVTAIWDEAFYGCSSLTSIKLPDNLNFLRASVFSQCSSLININIPNSLTYIPYETFRNCTNLTNIDLPETVIKIYEDAFLGCINLKSIELPKKLTYLGSGAFHSCKALTSIEIPETVTSIEGGVFAECWNLSNITIPNTITSIGAHAFFRCKIKSINIPEGVSSIGYGAFMLCSALESITIPNKVTSIEHDTFYGCTSLSNVSIPNTVTALGDEAFYGCSSLSNISIPSGVRFIGDSAFNGCSSLTSITIPAAVTTFYSSAFDNCTNLTKAIFQNTENWYRSGLSGESGEVPVDKLNLADEEKAAELLKESNYYWTNHY